MRHVPGPFGWLAEVELQQVAAQALVLPWRCSEDRFTCLVKVCLAGAAAEVLRHQAEALNLVGCTLLAARSSSHCTRRTTS